MHETQKNAPLAVAVIIARGGSKGLPRKNVLPVGGKPLVAWTIEHALDSKRLGGIVLSSDDEEILAVGRSYGIDIAPRPNDLAGDTITVDAAGRHGIETWERQHATQCDIVLLMYGNIALRPPDLTDRAIERLQASGGDSVQSVYPVGAKHPYWMRRLTGADGDFVEHWQPNEIFRRQDLPPCYMLNSGVLACRRECFFDVDPALPHNFLGKDRRAIITDETDVIDIDSEIDLLVAEALLKQRQTTMNSDKRSRGAA